MFKLIIWIILRILGTAVGIISYFFLDNRINVLLAEDQSWNAMLNGSNHEYISAVIARKFIQTNAYRWYRAMCIVDSILGEDHCLISFNRLKSRESFPQEYK